MSQPVPDPFHTPVPVAPPAMVPVPEDEEPTYQIEDEEAAEAAGTAGPVLPFQLYSGGEEKDVPDGDTLYQFEGKNVTSTAATITSVSSLDILDQVLPVDAILRMEVDVRVIGIRHVVNDKTGKLARMHVLKAIDSKLLPWENQ